MTEKSVSNQHSLATKRLTRQATSAWLLDFGGHRKVATGERELLHLLPQPQLLPVPLAPRHCPAVIRWQGQLLPVWDLAAWQGLAPTATEERLAAIVAYQQRPGQAPEFGALLLARSPQSVQVNDSQACVLPHDAPWETLASACFSYQDQQVPILDLLSMFSARRR